MSPERQLGLLWGGVAAALVLLSPLAPELARGLPPCLLKAVTGLPCPTCGAARVTLALARFDIAGALLMNPLVTLAAVVVVGGGIWSGARALAGRSVWQPPANLSNASRVGMVLAVLANWAYLVWAGT